jgi:hypothetical protein
MEFHYHRNRATPGLAEIERAIAQRDPAVLLDADLSGRLVRIATTLDECDLRDCLRHAGAQIGLDDLQRLPSVCCGGCGG